MDENFINRCQACAALPEARSFGTSGSAAVGSQTAIIECACGQKVERIAAAEGSAMPDAVAAWNVANME